MEMDDLEAELMDLAVNEHAYLPQAAHSIPRPAVVVQAPPAPADLPSRGVTRATATSLTPSHAKDRSKSGLPAALSAMYGGERTHYQAPVSSATKAPVQQQPAPASVSADAQPKNDSGDSGEEPPGWYDQIEMLLATAETKYYAWVEQMEIQGSVSEEELRVEEEARVARRRATVVELKERRRALLHNSLAAVVTHGSGNGASEDHADHVDVDAMMDKLADIVDESAKQLAALRESALWTRLVENLPFTERDYVAKGADEMFTEQMKYKREPEETQSIIERHLRAVFRKQPPMKNGQSVGRTMNHSLGHALREFADIFHISYGNPVVHSALVVPSPSQRDAAARIILPLLAADINQFASILVQVLYYKYPELPKSLSTSVVHKCVIDALFEHLQPTLHTLYAVAFDKENSFLSRLAHQMRAWRLDQFGVKQVFRLDGSWWRASHGSQDRSRMRDANELQLQSHRQYERVIHGMNKLPSHRSPWVKAELVAGVCRDLDGCIKAFYANQPSRNAPPSPAEINMSADDLSALLAFVLVSAPAACGHIATQLAILGSFMASESAMGEEGFAIATLWTSVSHLCHLTSC